MHALASCTIKFVLPSYCGCRDDVWDAESRPSLCSAVPFYYYKQRGAADASPSPTDAAIIWEYSQQVGGLHFDGAHFDIHRRTLSLGYDLAGWMSIFSP